MKFSFIRIMVLFLLSGTSLYQGHAESAVSLPYLNWYLSLDLGNYKVIGNKLNKLADKRTVAFHNEKNDFTVTVYLEINPNSDNIDNCRLFYINILRPKFVYDRSISFGKNDSIAFWNFFIGEYNGKTVDHKNVNACLVRDSACIDIHISKINYTGKDSSEFDRIIRSIRFMDKKSGQNDSAMTYYKEFALNQDELTRRKLLKSDSSSLSMLAYIHSVMDMDGKKALAQKFLSMKPAAGAGYGNFELGILYLLSLQYDTAEVYLTKALDKLKTNYNAWYIRGLVYLNSDRPDKAVSDLTKALKLKYDFEKAFLSRGIAYYKLKRKDKALDDFNSAIKLNPENSEALVYKGFVFKDLGKNKDAERLWKKAISIDPGWEKELKKYK